MPKALQAALGLAARGIRVFPCKQDKTPYTEHGFKDASSGNALIAEWWTRWPGALIGVPTGEVSSLDVLDLDAKHVKARTWWRENYRRFPRTRIHRTRAGGLHLLFKHDDSIGAAPARSHWASIRVPAAGMSYGGRRPGCRSPRTRRWRRGRHGS